MKTGMEALEMTSDRLKTESETYEERKNQLVSQFEGRFALISGKEVIGTWATNEDALKAGYEKCGLATPFLVKQISRIERVQFTSRELTPCQT
jgi:hypothetical protein